ncbi:hypothetical protein Tco_0553285 [Tanacetum coccineum]
MSSKHSTWPVLLCVYNLPPWLCMKRKYIMMSLLIEGPKQPGNDIDVYLAPLIDDLKTLWDKGVKVYDAYKRETFTLRAMIFCTISDFPAYGNLSGYSTKGKFACPVCEDQTSSRWLPNCKKTVFTGHRRSLVRNHPYRKMKRELDGTTEYGRVPSSYPANIKKLVSVQDCKLVGMKSHDCHVFMTHMIPIAIRGLLPNNVRHTITKLCLFFNMIHSKVIDLEVLDSWQSDIILTLCELEMYFPPSFFDVMVHLVSHIIAEIKACGLVYLHYMYPFERYMGVLKGYVRNQVRPEGSIITGYLAEELIEFGNDVMKGVRNIGIPHSRHEGRLAGVGTIGLRMIDPDRDALKVAHSVVLQHMTCLTSYIEQHKQMLRVTHRGRTNKWYQSKHNEEFSYWLKDIVTENLGKPNVDKTVERLGEGPRCVVRSYQGYDINGYTFYTEMQDEKSTVQNSRVTLIASTMEFDRSNHDAMATIAKNSFYGVIQEIWELDYNTFTIPLFKCKWVTNNARDDNLDTSPIAPCLLTTLTSPQQTPTQTTPQTTLQTNPQTTSQSTPPTPLSTPSPQTTPTPPTTPPPPPPTSQHPMVTRSKVRIVKANPKYNLHDLRDPNWKQAMCDEYKALIDNNIWVLVPRPPNVNIVCSMWLYKHKYNADGSLNRYKARLVANGRSQQQGIDYDETFSPVVKPATIRTVLGLAEPNTAYLLLYVDDIILTASSTSLLQRIISLLHAEFAIADLGPFNYFLGISATRTTSGIFLTPIDTEKKLGPEGSLVTDPTLYCNLAESLQYLTFTRPNLSYAIQQLCLYMHDPREPHLNAMKCILCYPATRRSTSRYCVFLGDNLLTWSSKCQDMLSRSSVEAKYRGVTNAIAETSWICNLRCELHTPLFTATLVYYDNVSAVYMSANLVQHQRSKHIEIDIHFIRGKLAAGHV